MIGTIAMAGFAMAGTKMTVADGHLAAGTVDGDALVASDVLPFAMVGTWAGLLDEPTVIDGVPCAADRVRFEVGHLTHCRLSAPVERGGVRLPEGAVIERFRTGARNFAVVTVPNRWTHRGVHCDAGERIALDEAGDVRFRIRTPPHAVHKGLPLVWSEAVDSPDRLALHPDGALAQGILGSAHRFGAVELPAHSVVYLDPEGRLYRVDTHATVRWGTREIPPGNTVLVDATGEITVRSLYVVVEDLQHPHWRVTSGLYYGYPWNEVLGRP